MSDAARPARLIYVDSARGLACMLAILSHLGVEQFRFVDYPGLELISVLTRTATPIFMVLFGTMIAVVYMTRLQAGPDAQASVVSRLLARAMTCYLAYGAITSAAVVGDKIDLENAAEAMVFLGGGRFGEVLKIYSILFLAILALLPLIRRFGLAALVGAAAAAWGLRYALGALVAPGDYQLQFFFGYASGFGPAVMLCLTFVAFGGAVGGAIAGQRGFAAAALAGVAALLVLAAGAVAMGPVKLAYGLGTYQFRGANHPLYFAYGIVAAGAVMLMFAAAGRRGLAPRTTGLLARIGTRSLFFYTFGNVAMNLLPTYEGHPLAALALSLGFLALLTMMTLDLARDDSRLDRLLGGVLSGFRQRYDAAMRELFRWSRPIL